jgi:hypothetical protein
MDRKDGEILRREMLLFFKAWYKCVVRKHKLAA